MALSEDDKRRIGGSDVAAIVGVSPHAGPLSVYMRIVEGVEREDTPALSRGRRLEPVVLDWYAETTGRELVRAPALCPKRQHHRASLDGISRERRGNLWRVVEAKTAGARDADRWGDDGTDSIPAEYLCQTQYYMGVGHDLGSAEDDVCDVPALIAGDFRLYRVAYDEETYDLLVEAVDRFWVDHVLPKRPPEPTALPNDAEAIRRRFRRHEGEQPLDFAALPPEAKVTLEEYLRAYAEEAAAAERLVLWESRAKMVVGGAPGVAGLPADLGMHRIDWRAQKGKPAWKAAAEKMAKQFGVSETQLSALAAENTGEGARPFQPRPVTKGKR